MKIGLQITRFNYPNYPHSIRGHLTKLARAADEGGFYSLWVMDHYFQMEMIGGPAEPMMEAYTTLSYLAAVTERVKLGALVTGVIYRQPAFLVKQVTGLDILSGGRAYLGIGAAWYEREALGLGFPYPPLADRFEQLEETLQICHQMWGGSEEPFEGRHYRLEEPINQPQPLTKPHPPIMIGGMGEKKTLRLLAQYGDACNFFTHVGMDQLAQKLDVLKAHCEDVGRDYAEIEKTALSTYNFTEQSPAQVIEHIESLGRLGFSHVIFNLPRYETVEPVEMMANDIIAKVADL